MLKQHLTHLILEMIGEDIFMPHIEEYNQALQDLREKVPELVEKINNLIEYDKMKK